MFLKTVAYSFENIANVLSLTHGLQCGNSNTVLFQGGSYIFEFQSFADLHVCREFVGKSH